MAVHHLLLGLLACCMAGQALAKAAADSTDSRPLPGVPDPSTDALVEWVRRHGGEVNVAVRSTPDRGRTTYADRDMQPGDVLARIPVELVYVANKSWGDSDEAAGAQLIVDMADPDSFWRPMFSALPAKSGVFDHRHVPHSYLSILQDPDTEEELLGSRQSVQHYCELLQPTYRQLGLNITLADCQYGAALLSTRQFAGYGTGAILLPIVDQANHNNACVHTHRLEPCDPDKGLQQWQQGLTPPAIPPSLGAGLVAGGAGGDGGDASACPNTSACSANTTGLDRGGGVSGVCIAWRAETAVARGQEVYNSYGTMTNDRSLLQYGFLQDDVSIQLALQAMDRPERPLGMDGVWYSPATQCGGAWPPPFSGSTALELWQEAARLSARLAKFKAGSEAIAAIVPDAAADPDGRILGLMRTWREQRLFAIEVQMESVADDALNLGVDAYDLDL